MHSRTPYKAFSSGCDLVAHVNFLKHHLCKEGRCHGASAPKTPTGLVSATAIPVTDRTLSPRRTPFIRLIVLSVDRMSA